MEIGPILRAMSRHKLRLGLIAAQIAITLAIIANCVTLIQDARRRMVHPRDFDEDNLVQIWLYCQDTALRDDRRRSLWTQETLERLRAIPGVRAATSTWFSPFGDTLNWRVKAAGSDAAMLMTPQSTADERFLDALGAELDEGRWFSHEDVERAEELRSSYSSTKRERGPNGTVLDATITNIVITRALGQHFFGEGPLVGKMLEDPDGDLLRIIGVLRHAHHFQIASPPRPPEYFIFNAGYAHYYAEGVGFMARSEPGQADVVAQRIEAKLLETNDLPEKSVWLVSELRDVHDGRARMTATLMGLLVFLLLVVASLGIAGVTSFSVTARTRQIGARRALGATASDILRYFLTEAGLLTTLGLFIGAGLAVLLNMALLKVYDGAKLGSGIVAGCALLLWLVGLGAALPPALRASRISPAIATRNV